MITLNNIERGSGGVPTSFVQDCLSSTRAIYENKFNRKWLIFRARVIQKTFSEAYRSEDFILIKVEFKLFQCVVLLICLYFIVGAIIMNRLFQVFTGNARQKFLRFVTMFMAAIALHF